MNHFTQMKWFTAKSWHMVTTSGWPSSGSRPGDKVCDLITCFKPPGRRLGGIYFFRAKYISFAPAPVLGVHRGENPSVLR